MFRRGCLSPRQFKILSGETGMFLKIRPPRPDIRSCMRLQRILVGPDFCYRVISVHNDDTITCLSHSFEVVTELITKFSSFDMHVAKLAFIFG